MKIVATVKLKVVCDCALRENEVQGQAEILET
jgi:hypothetical protein